MKTELGMGDLKEQLDDIHRRNPKFKQDDLFVCWFMRAYLADDDHTAVESVTGGSGDKSVDAVLVDHKAQAVFLVQGKYRQSLKAKAESRNDVLGFAALAGPLLSKEAKAFKSLCKGANPDVAKRLADARNVLLAKEYRLRMFYVTLGTVSEHLEAEAINAVEEAAPNAVIEVLDADRLMNLLRDYLDGVAPPIPSLDLTLEQHADVRVNSILQRYDTTNKVESWVLSMRGDAVARMFDSAGIRLYARNIRGFLGGETPINSGMIKTLTEEPDHFFYYNNGITIICDRAVKHSHAGGEFLRVSNPQVINGQQTSRMLAQHREHAANASVLVKVMQVPRVAGVSGGDAFDTLVSRIVANTNWQNAINHADLVSNHRVQIEIERALRKRGYFYLRKRQKKAEARAAAGKSRFIVTKEELAQAVGACELDPLLVRQGKNKLFGHHYESIFAAGRDADFYLSRFHARAYVTVGSKGQPQRGYAKWLVLHFLWSRLAGVLKSATAMRRFVDLTERKDKSIQEPMGRAVEMVFKDVMAFYGATKGKGEQELDHSRFFKTRGLHKKFAAFWKQRDKNVRLDPVLEEIRETLAT